MKRRYNIYPCDIDVMGNCPKHCQNCAECIGWYVSETDNEEPQQDYEIDND